MFFPRKGGVRPLEKFLFGLSVRLVPSAHELIRWQSFL